MKPRGLLIGAVLSLLLWMLMYVVYTAKAEFSITGVGVPYSTVGTPQLRTATGSASADCTAGMTATMNDYSFMPAIYGGGCSPIPGLIAGVGADAGTTIGQISINGAPAGTTAVVRWRYFTASDNPVIWVLHDATGSIVGTWVADDPCNLNAPQQACLTVPVMTGITTKRYVSADLDAMTIPANTQNIVREKMRRQGLKTTHERFRMLQALANDDAPAKWIHNHMRVNPGNGRLICKGVC